MNILFFIHRYPNYGGTEKVTTVLCNELVAHGHKVVLASLYQKSWELMGELSEKVEFISLSYPTLSVSNVRRLRKIINNNKVDFVINQWCLPFKTTLLLKFVLLKQKTKLISVLHGSPNVNMRLIAADRSIKQSVGMRKLIARINKRVIYLGTCISLRLVYELSDQYLLLSDRFERTFMEMAGIKQANKLSSITNPLTIGGNGNLPCHKKKQVLYVGRMDILNKNVDRIVSAWGKLSERYSDWEMVLVGDGPDRRYLEELVVNKGIKNIRFIGFIKEEPIKYYNDASIFILTSDLEGFGLVITEAMAFACVPVVYASYPAVYDIIEDGKSGVILPFPYDEEYACAQLSYLIENENVRNNMSKNAIARAQFFSPDKIVEKWEGLFARLSGMN